MIWPPIATPPWLQTIAFHNPSSFKEEKSDACIFFQITLNSGRSTELKQRFYKTLADRLHEGVKIPKEDVFINFVEVPKENWSFGNGEAQYVTPPK